MPKITRLERQKRNKERVNVYLAGEFAFGLAILEAARLRVGQELSDDEIRTLKARDTYHKAFERVLRLLGRRARTEREIREYLRKHGYTDEVVEEVVQRLHALNLLDDAAFAREWIENRTRHRPRGRQALISELRRKGVAQETIEAALDDASLDEPTLAIEAAERYVIRLQTIDDYATFARKLGSYLARRGFSWEAARHAVNHYWQLRTQDNGRPDFDNEHWNTEE